MRVLTLTCVLLVAAGTAGAEANNGADPVSETLDLLNWGLGIFYAHHDGLGQESNGLEAKQDDATATPNGLVPADVLLLP